MSDVILEKIDKEVMVVPLFFNFMLKRLFVNNINICKRFFISILDIDISIDNCGVSFNKINIYNNYFDIEVNGNFFVRFGISNNISYEDVRLYFYLDDNNIGEDIISCNNINVGHIYYLLYYKKMFLDNNIDMLEKDYWLAFLSGNSFKELNDILKYLLNDKERGKLIGDIFDLCIDVDVLDELESLIFS